MTQARCGHSCKLITDCDGNKQVVVVGGADPETSALQSGMNSTEIYDVDSGTWSAGKRNEIFPNCGTVNHSVVILYKNVDLHSMYT